MKVLVFARAPVPGRCKTRLIPQLGAVGAARVQHRLATRTIATAVAAGAQIELWCAPDCAHGFFQARRRESQLTLRRQAAGDLGVRMRRALARGPALLIGTDCPGLTTDDLRAAWTALKTTDCVLQAATDGGYVLIGARGLEPRALAGIAWSSGHELAQTRRRLARLGLRCTLLPPRADLDTPGDYRRARRAGLL